jgi:hypothetical protein
MSRKKDINLLILVFFVGLIAGCKQGPELAKGPSPGLEEQSKPPIVEGLLDSADVRYQWEVNLEGDGEAALTVTAYGPETSWDKKGGEAAVLSVHVDGIHKGDVVLFNGATPHDYEILLGPLTQGEHRITFSYDSKKSAPQAQGVRIESCSLQLYTPDDPLYDVIRHAPIIYGRKDARYSDVPLLMYHEKWTRGEHTVIQYTVIFSNEDGGTPPEGLMARWGRLTDIEWAYRVELDKDGELVKEEYQGNGHETVRFRGKKDGRHPLLRVCTKNNMFSDRGESPYKFALLPEASLPEGHSREELMDLNPWSYRIMSLEWMREGAKDAGGPATVAVSDLRNYVYIEFNTCSASGRSDCAGQAVLIKLRDDPKWYPSDHENPSLDVKSCGWRRVTVEVPPGKGAEDIEAVRFAIRSEERGAPLCALRSIGKVFMLDESFMPTPSVLEWHGELFLDTDPDTPNPDQVTFTVTD